MREAEHGLVSRSQEEDLALAGPFMKGFLEKGQNCKHGLLRPLQPLRALRWAPAGREAGMP